MGAILTLAGRDLKSILRDKFALFWIFAFPLMYALFFGSIFGGDDEGARSRIPIAVVDEAGSEASAGLVQRLAEHESLRVSRDGEGTDAPPRLDSLEDARGAVRRGQKVAYLRILPGYGDSPFQMFSPEDSGQALELGIDPSRSAEGGMLRGILMQSVFGGFSASFTDKEKMLGRSSARATRSGRRRTSARVRSSSCRPSWAPSPPSSRTRTSGRPRRARRTSVARTWSPSSR